MKDRELETKAAEEAAISEVAAIISDFRERITNRTLEPDKFASLDEIETQWSQLRHKTDLIYQDLVSELIKSVDETELIAKKKLNGADRESN